MSSSELHQHQTVEVAAATPLDISDTSIISSTTNDAIDCVGLLCSLTTMLFFAAPFSNLVSVKTHGIIVNKNKLLKNIIIHPDDPVNYIANKTIC